jgi:hypothetical protein
MTAPERFSGPEFARLVEEFGRLRTTEAQTPKEDSLRLKFLLEAVDEQPQAIPVIYGARLREAKDRLDRHLQPIGAYLESVGMTWRICPEFVVGGPIWTESQLSNFLIYALGLSPHDPWNIILTVSNPVASIDLNMPMFRKAIQDEFAARLEAEYAPLDARWNEIEADARRTKDPRDLASLARDIRARLQEDVDQTRRAMAQAGAALNRGDLNF